MPKTNAQIQQEYNALPWLSQMGVAADDMIRIAGSAVSGGLADQLDGPDGADRTHEARVRAGIAGDIANVGGMVAGLKGAGAVAKGAVSAARAAPTALSLAKTAGLGTAARYLTGTAGPGLVPAAGRITLATAGKLAGLAGLLGLSIAGRQDATPAAPAKSPQPVQQALKQGREAAPAVTPYERQLAVLDMILKSPNMSMADLRDVTGMLPARPKPPSSGDVAIGQAALRADALYKQQVANALANTDPELGAKALEKAKAADFNRWATLAGRNPLATQQAIMIDPTAGVD